MAELEINTCCTPEAQASCCEPDEKADCCGHSHGCGCQEGARESDLDAVRETVR